MLLTEILSNAEMDRKNNRLFEILGIIWRTEGISRRELAKELRASKVSVINYINKLIDRGVIEEQPSICASHGRRPASLVLTKDLFYSIGVNFYREGTSSVLLLNACSEVVDEFKLPEEILQAREKCDFAIHEIRRVIEKNSVPFDKIIGVGIALPGIVKPLAGEVRASSLFNDEANFNISDYFKANLGKPCFLINPAHLQAFNEHKWGNAKKMNSFLTIQSGFGLGIFMNGSLYKGHQFNAGQLGAIQLQNAGPVSSDGRTGTLSGIASFYKITTRIEEVIEQGGNTLVKEYLSEGKKKVTLEMLVKAIENGDRLCAQMMSETFDTIGRAIVNLAYIFNPEAIFLPDWTARCPDVSLEVVRRMMGHYGASNWELKTDILSSKCGACDFARGAAIIPGERFFKGNRI